MERIGLDRPAQRACPHHGGGRARSPTSIGFPLIIRPSFTLGGTGGGVVTDPDAFRGDGCARPGRQHDRRDPDRGVHRRAGRSTSWRSCGTAADNVVIVCSIENFDPMGVHTGDSITVAPAQTLTDREYQRMRDAAIACIREIGVETGGSNIQFAVHPGNGRHGRHRDEPAGLPLLGPRVQGHRVPHRQDRGQARRRLHPGRDPQRHHQEHAGLLRAVHRLLRGEDPALRLREVPRRPTRR